MKIAAVISCLLCFFIAKAQDFSGVWKGTITRDFGKENRIDTLVLDLKQVGDSISGYSTLIPAKGIFIKCRVEGNYLLANKMLKLSETVLVETSLPKKAEIIFDNYFLNYDEASRDALDGKCIAKYYKVMYGRSLVMLHRN